MKFGIFDHMDRAHDNLGRQYADRLQLVEAYDEAGFYGYHLAEHHSTPLGLAPSPSVFLSAAAQRTTRIRIGALVHTLSLYHPLRLFEEICMLDQLSGGRLNLGIGRGISPIEMGYYGVDMEAAGQIYLEVSEILLKAFESETLTYSGQYFGFQEVPVVMSPHQKPHPPLWYGVGHPNTAAWTAENEINIVCNGTAESVRQITDRYRLEWAAAAKPPTGIPLMGMSRHLVVADTTAEAHELARAAYEQWFDNLTLLWRLHDQAIPLSFPADFTEAVDSGFCIAGDAAHVRARLHSEVESAGVNYLLARMAFGNLPVEASLRSVELFAAEVMPSFEPVNAVSM